MKITADLLFHSGLALLSRFIKVIGAFLLNKKAKKPIVDLAVGPVACIIFGILLNVLLLIRLIAVPAAG